MKRKRNWILSSLFSLLVVSIGFSQNLIVYHLKKGETASIAMNKHDFHIGQLCKVMNDSGIKANELTSLPVGYPIILDSDYQGELPSEEVWECSRQVLALTNLPLLQNQIQQLKREKEDLTNKLKVAEEETIPKLRADLETALEKLGQTLRKNVHLEGAVRFWRENSQKKQSKMDTLLEENGTLKRELKNRPLNNRRSLFLGILAAVSIMGLIALSIYRFYLKRKMVFLAVNFSWGERTFCFEIKEHERINGKATGRIGFVLSENKKDSEMFWVYHESMRPEDFLPFLKKLHPEFFREKEVIKMDVEEEVVSEEPKTAFR